MHKKQIVLGVTGSIGSGKSTVARMVRHLHIPTFEADACVHRLYAEPEIIEVLSRRFPLAVEGGRINRQKLFGLVFGDLSHLSSLENILHPYVQREARRFIEEHRVGGAGLCVLDVPLLYEANFEKLCHYVIVLSAEERVRRDRVLARPGMDHLKYLAVDRHQMPAEEKNRRADFVLDTNGMRRSTLQGLCEILKKVCEDND